MTPLLTPAEFEAQYREGYRRTVGLLVRQGAPFNDVEDLAQTAWTNAWERLAQYQSRGSFIAWVQAIARNALRNHVREEPKHEPLDYKQGAWMDMGGLAEWWLLHRLPASDARILREYFVEQDRDGPVPTALRVRAHRACQRARIDLESAA